MYIPKVLSILDDNDGTSMNEEMIKTLVRDNFGRTLEQNKVECIVEPALYEYSLINYYTTTRPFGYQLSGVSDVHVTGASLTPERYFSQFYASSEERQNEIYEPIIDWVFDNQD